MPTCDHISETGDVCEEPTLHQLCGRWLCIRHRPLYRAGIKNGAHYALEEKPEARLAEAKARETRKLLRATTRNGS